VAEFPEATIREAVLAEAWEAEAGVEESIYPETWRRLS
jgi:hypothetical protein